MEMNERCLQVMIKSSLALVEGLTAQQKMSISTLMWVLWAF